MWRVWPLSSDVKGLTFSDDVKVWPIRRCVGSDLSQMMCEWSDLSQAMWRVWPLSDDLKSLTSLSRCQRSDLSQPMWSVWPLSDDVKGRTSLSRTFTSLCCSLRVQTPLILSVVGWKLGTKIRVQSNKVGLRTWHYGYLCIQVCSYAKTKSKWPVQCTLLVTEWRMLWPSTHSSHLLSPGMYSL